MLFAMRYEVREASEDKEKRSLTLFTHWKPPAGYEFKSHYAFADGNGGMAIVEAASTAAIAEAHAPWGPFFHFKITPIIEIDKAVPIFQRVQAWRDSIK